MTKKNTEIPGSDSNVGAKQAATGRLKEIVSVGVILVTVGISYGSLISRVEQVEKENASIDQAIAAGFKELSSDLKNDIKEVKNDVKELKNDNIKKIEIKLDSMDRRTLANTLELYYIKKAVQ